MASYFLYKALRALASYLLYKYFYVAAKTAHSKGSRVNAVAMGVNAYVLTKLLNHIILMATGGGENDAIYA
jgi:hypothetical protein